MGRGTKQMSKDTTEGMMEKHKGSKTGQEPTKEPAEYVDPLTGGTIEGESMENLLDNMTAAGVAPLSREDLRKRHGHGFNAQALLIPQAKTAAEREGKADEEWEHFSIDLSRYPDVGTQRRARRIVIDTVSHPDFQWQKPQAGEKKATPYVVKGWRAVMASGIHSEQAGAEAHMHLWAHVNVLAAGGTSVLAAKHAIGANDQVYAAVSKQVNDALAAAGLQPLEWLAPNRKAGSSEQQEQTRRDADMLSSLPEGVSAEAAAVAVSFDTHTESVRFDTQADAALKEATQARKVYEEAAMRAGMLQRASEAVKTAENLRRNLAEAAEAKARAEAEARAAKQEAEQSEHNRQQFYDRVMELTTETERLEANRKEAADTVAALAEALGVDAEGEASEDIMEAAVRKIRTRDDLYQQSEAARTTLAADNQAILDALAAAGVDSVGDLAQERDKALATAATAKQAAKEARDALTREREALTQAQADLVKEQAARNEQQAEFKQQMKELQEQFKQDIKESQDRFKEELKDLRQQHAEAMKEAKAEERGKWETVVDSLKEQLKALKEQIKEMLGVGKQQAAIIEQLRKAKPAAATGQKGGAGGGKAPK